MILTELRRIRFSDKEMRNTDDTNGCHVIRAADDDDDKGHWCKKANGRKVQEYFSTDQ